MLGATGNPKRCCILGRSKNCVSGEIFENNTFYLKMALSMEVMTVTTNGKKIKWDLYYGKKLLGGRQPLKDAWILIF